MNTHYDINWLTKKIESGETFKFIFFWGNTNKYNEEVGKFCFSQWFESSFVVDNVIYKTAEWNKRKFEIVKLGNIHKFNQNTMLGDYLLNTENKILVEASPVDTVWGIGLSQDSNEIENIYAWRGENLLGFALMETREFLRDFGYFKTLDFSFQPPWKKFPDIEENDMFWRMGKGEDYLNNFSKYYEKLSEKEKRIYQLYNPSPYEWTNLYN